MLALEKLRARLGGLWLNPDFLRLWAGQTISELGSHITYGGLPLIAVITLGASPFQMGVLSALGSAPVLVFGLFAGVWVDRLRRRPVLIAADLARGLLLLTIPLAAVLGALRIEQLYVIAALAGALTVFFSVAYMAYLPSLVERENIVEGNSKLAFTNAAAEIVGPQLTGVLVQLITAPFAIILDALTFFVSALSLRGIRKPEAPPNPPETRLPISRELSEGLLAVLRHPVLRALAAAEGTLNFFGSFYAALYSLYAIRTLGMGPAALGLTIAFGGAGSLLGSLLARRAVARFGLNRAMIGSLAAITLLNLLIPLARGPVLAAVAVLAVSQLFGDCARTIYFINSVSLRQSVTPDRLLGRVNAGMELLTAGVAPLGALVGGALAAVAGIRSTLVVAALGGVLGGLWLLFSAVRGLRSHPSEVNTGEKR